MTQDERVWKWLQEHNTITSLEMFDRFYIVAPHAIIRNLRNKYGAGAIQDEWLTKTRKEVDSKGKEHKVTIRYKKYFLQKLEGIA